jgi:hypothetical protein
VQAASEFGAIAEVTAFLISRACRTRSTDKVIYRLTRLLASAPRPGQTVPRLRLPGLADTPSAPAAGLKNQGPAPLGATRPNQEGSPPSANCPNPRRFDLLHCRIPPCPHNATPVYQSGTPIRQIYAYRPLSKFGILPLEIVVNSVE